MSPNSAMKPLTSDADIDAPLDATMRSDEVS